MLQIDFVVNGRYRILDTLGIGGMGTVYAAQDERLGRHVALKVLRSDIAQDQRARERFLREAQIAAQLIHPNIVRTYDVGEAPEGPFLVQELLDGHTLDTQLPLAPVLAHVVATGVADALHAIHSQGYVHCDVKPQNIMLVGDLSQPRVVLLDFGIARLEGTDTTTLIATPHYLAPERALGAAPTAASDLYALGIVLFHALAGRPPFDAPAIHAIIEQQRSAPLPPLNIAAGATPAETSAWDAIIRKLTAKEPHERYRSAAALREDLNALLAGSLHLLPTQVVVERPRPVAAAPIQAHQPPLAPPAPQTAHKPLSRRSMLLPLVLGALLLGALLFRQARDTAATAEPGLLQPSAAATTSASPATSLVTVPDVIGQPLDTAQARLQAAGLNGVVGATVTHEQPAGNVVGMAPGPSEMLVQGGTVQLQVSSGPPAAPAADQPAEDNEKGDGKQDEGRGKGKGKGRKGD